MAGRALPDLVARLKLDNSDLEKAMTVAKAMAREMQTTAGISTTGLRKIQTEAEATHGHVTRLGSAFAGLRERVGGTTSAFVGFAGPLLGVAGGIATVYTALDKVVIPAASFQQQMVKLVGTAGESEAGLKGVSAGILQMAGDVGYGAAQLADGMYLIESAGFHGQAGLNVLRQSAMAAKAENAELATVANAVTTALNAYGLGATQTAHVTDVLLTATSQGKMTFQDLAGSLDQILPVASAAKIGLNEVAAAIAVQTAQGTPAAVAATNLQYAIKGLQVPTSTAQAAIEGLGLKSTRFADDLAKKGLLGTLAELTALVGKKFPAGSAAYNAAISNILGNQEGLNAVLQLSGTHAKTFADDLAGMNAAAGKTKSSFDEMMATTGGKWSAFTARLGAEGILVGTNVLPVLGQVVDALSRQIGPAFAGLGTIASQVGQGIGIIRGAVNDLSTGANGAQAVFRTLWGTLHVDPAVAAGFSEVLGPAIDRVMEIVSTVRRAFEGLVFDLQHGADPVKSLATFFSDLGLPMGTARDLADHLHSIWANLTAAAKELWPAISAVGSALATALPVLQDMATTAMPAVIGLAEGLSSLLAPALTLIADNMNVIGPIVAGLAIGWGIWQAAIIVSNVVLAIQTVGIYAYVAATYVMRTAVAIWTAAQWLLNVALDANPIGLVIIAIAALIAIVILVVTHWNEVVGVLTAVWDWIKKTSDSHTFLGVVISALFGPIIQLVSHWGDVTGALGSVIQWLGHAGDAFSALGSLASGVASAVGNAFSGLGSGVHGGLSSVAKIIDNFDAMVDKLPVIGGILNLPRIPAFAQGGIVNRPTVGLFGEAGPEALIPLGAGKRGQGLKLLQQAGKALGLGAGASQNPGDWGGQCVAKGTLVATANGMLPIEDVRVGDQVWTRQGLKAVTWSGITRRAAVVLDISTTGPKLSCTPDHRLLRAISGGALASTGPALPTNAMWSPDDHGVVGVVGVPVRAMGLVALRDRMPNDFQPPAGRGPAPTAEVGQEGDKDSAYVQRAVDLPAVHAQVRTGPRVELVPMPAAHGFGEVVHDIGICHAEAEADLAGLGVHESDVALSFEQACRPGDFEWVRADEVWIDDVLLQFHGTYFTGVTVEAARIARGRVDTYDLTVADAHEFVAGGIVVHNCVVYVENVTGHHFDVAMASQMASSVTTSKPAPGEIFVSTIPPFGHTGIVIGGGKVIDSNWGLDERIRIHNLSDVPDIAGYIAGLRPSGLPGGLFDVSGTLKGLVNRALGGAGDWPGSLAKGLLGQAIDGLAARFDDGGVWPSGTLGANTSGQDEYVLTQDQARRLGGRTVIINGATLQPLDERRVVSLLQEMEWLHA